MKKYLTFILIVFTVAIMTIPVLADPRPGDEPDGISPTISALADPYPSDEPDAISPILLMQVIR